MTSIQEVYPHIFIDNKWNPLLKRQKNAYDKCVEYIDTSYRPSAFGAASNKIPIVIPTQFITVTNVPMDENPDQVLEYMFYIDDTDKDKGYYGTYYYIQINGLYYKIENFKLLPSANLPSNIKSLQKVTPDNKITISFREPFSGTSFSTRNYPDQFSSKTNVDKSSECTSTACTISGGRKYNYKTKNRKLKLYNNKSRKSIKSIKSRKSRK